MKRKLQALGVLLAMGVVKLPLEQHVTTNLRAQHLLDEPIEVSALESMGQSGMVGILGGLRGLVASILQLRAHVEFTRVNWAQVDSLYRIVTRLQPRNDSYWDEASWHMAYNASGNYLYDESRPRELRGTLYEQHVKRGIEILEKGLVFCPDSPKLLERLADIYFRKSFEYKKAGDAYWQAYKHGGLSFTRGFAGFAYARASDPESWQKAYDILKADYDQGRATPGLIEHLKAVEGYLHIPAEKRIPDAVQVPKSPRNLPGPLRP